jgi:translin
MDMNLTPLFDKIKEDLDKLDEKRESILPVSRNIVRICSEIIKSVHRGQLEGINDEIQRIRDLIASIKDRAQDTLNGMGKNYLGIVYQEFTEAVTFYHLIKNGSIPDFEEIGVKPFEYLLGLADLLGELKRMVLNKLRVNNLSTAEKLYEYMEEIHEALFGLDYPSGLLPGFRKKIDTTRHLLNSTLELLVSSKKIYDLKETLEKTSKK